MMEWLFLRGYARQLRKVTPDAPTQRDLRRRIAADPGAHRIAGSGPHQVFNQLLVDALRASVSLLQHSGLSRAEAVAVARTAFLRNGTGLSRWGVRFWLAITRDPVAELRRRRDLPARAERLWGEALKTRFVEGEKSVALEVTGCPFADYFWNMAEPDLTPILCAYDMAWMAEVNASRRPVVVGRSGTIAGGAEVCDFTFRFQPKPQRRLYRHPLNQARPVRPRG